MNDEILKRLEVIEKQVQDIIKSLKEKPLD